MKNKKEGLVFLPVSLNITGKKIALIGGGKVAYHKASILNRFATDVTVISPEFHPGFTDLPFRYIRKKIENRDLIPYFLVYICTENESLNAEIKAACDEQGILASVCDNPTLCDFISPAIYKEENITIAVSSNAANVQQSIAIRNRIGELVGNGQLNIENINNDTL